MKAEFNIDTMELVREVAQEVIKALEPMLSGNGDGDRLMTTEDLCEYLQVNKNWVYQQVHSKSIPFNKAGNKLRFRKDEIDRYLDQNNK